MTIKFVFYTTTTKWKLILAEWGRGIDTKRLHHRFGSHETLVLYTEVLLDSVNIFLSSKKKKKNYQSNVVLCEPNCAISFNVEIYLFSPFIYNHILSSLPVLPSSSDNLIPSSQNRVFLVISSRFYLPFFNTSGQKKIVFFFLTAARGR